MPQVPLNYNTSVWSSFEKTLVVRLYFQKNHTRLENHIELMV